jgi:hypothetical protein
MERKVNKIVIDGIEVYEVTKDDMDVINVYKKSEYICVNKVKSIRRLQKKNSYGINSEDVVKDEIPFNIKDLYDRSKLVNSSLQTYRRVIYNIYEKEIPIY